MNAACIAIPTLSAMKTLRPLVKSLSADPAVGCVLILDNGHRAEAKQWLRVMQRKDPKVVVVDTRGWGLHRMWNYGWDYARDQGFGYYGAFNDDLVVPANVVRDLADALDRDPALWIVSPDWQRPLADGVAVTGRVNRVTGTQRHGGIAGWCWLARTNIPVRVDEQFEWWYGDCSLAEDIRLSGGALGIVEGLPLDHVQETTARKHPWTRDAIVRDGQRYEAKYGPGTAIPYRVSVLIPTMNRPDRLRRAVKCVLAQDYPSFEVIVQNGGERLRPTTDVPHDPLADDRVVLRQEPDKGICNALNLAAEAATGDVWHMACDDDEMAEGTLWSAASALRTGEQWTYGWMRSWSENQYGRRKRVMLLSARLWPWNLDEHKAANSINQPTAFWAREAYEKHGPFHEDFPMIWDYEWWMRLGVRYMPVQRDHCDADYVIWPGSTSVHAEAEMRLEVERLQALWKRVGYGER